MEETKEMLDHLGIAGVEELFKDIPDKIRSELKLEEGLTEMEVMNRVKDILKENRSLSEFSNFMGGGIYRHYVPTAVNEVVSRSEFYSSYTPYQPEISQGMLQALFEYQSLICELTGMEAANTSMYDYPTALAEAILMSDRINRRKKHRFLVPENIHWEIEPVLKNYLRGTDIILEWVKYDKTTGQIDKEDLKRKAGDDMLGFFVSSPNVFGVLEEDTKFYSDIKDETGSVMVAGCDPLSLTLLQPPSEWGADIVVGDSQPFGIPPSFGGPTVGIFACKGRYIRRMPGRMIGETVDKDDERAYCMLLQTREQHIRRDRATSNICTNQSLMALASAVHMFVKGGKGLEKIAKKNYDNAHRLASLIEDIDGYSSPSFDSEFFNEFLIGNQKMIDLKEFKERCKNNDILPGIPLGSWTESKFKELPPSLLIAVTEMNDAEDMEVLVNTLQEVKE